MAVTYLDMSVRNSEDGHLENEEPIGRVVEVIASYKGWFDISIRPQPHKTITVRDLGHKSLIGEMIGALSCVVATRRSLWSEQGCCGVICCEANQLVVRYRFPLTFTSTTSTHHPS